MDHLWEGEVESELGGTPAHYADRIYEITRRLYRDVSPMARVQLCHGFTCFGDDLSFDAAGLFLSWVRLASHEKFLHMGAGTGRLAWHAHLLTGAYATSVETTQLRAKIASDVSGVARREFWRCPELLEGVSKVMSAHRFIAGEAKRITLQGDVFLLSDLHTTRDERLRLDASLANCHFRIVASYHPPQAWRFLWPCSTIEPNSMMFGHDNIAGAPRRIFLYERPALSRPTMQLRALPEVKPRPWLGWVEDTTSVDDDADETLSNEMNVDKHADEMDTFLAR